MPIDRRAFLAGVSGVAAGLTLVKDGETALLNAMAAPGAAPSTVDPKALLDRANADPEFKRAARYWDARLRLEVGDHPYDVVVRAGKIAELSAATSATAAPDVKIWAPRRRGSRGLPPRVSKSRAIRSPRCPVPRGDPPACRLDA